MTLYVGTSGWAYSAWKPGFYPPKLPSKDFLRFYATQLNAVEANYTFRRFLTPEIVKTWLEQTPRTFRFAVKAHQSITHFRRLKNVEEPLHLFLDSIQPLAKARRLGPVLVQLPPNFKADAARLSEFLKLLPRRFRFAFEFRHESWFSEEIFALLRRKKVALCVAETDDFQTPAITTAEFAYYRLRRSDYSRPARRKIASDMRRRMGESAEVYAFFKHEERPESPLWARELLNAV